MSYLQNYNPIISNYLKSFLLCCSLLCFLLLSANAANAATFMVSNVNNAGAGSLRQAMLDANAAVSTNVIVFSFSGGVVRTINLTSALPDITRDLTIDGTTMTGYVGAPLVELNGASAGAAANGLTNANGNLYVKALIINRFSGDGIRAICTAICNSAGPFFNTLAVTGSYIGTDKFGISASPNGGNGIYYQPYRPSKSTIGGNLANQLNVISGNGKNGILLRRTDTGSVPPSFSDVAIINNYIGTNALGAAAIGNTLNGIAIEDTSTFGHGLLVYVGSDLNGVLGSPQTLIGDRNIISGNGANGILSNVQQTLIDIKNNYIGTNLSGTVDLGNVLDGINVSGAGIGAAVNLQIGGATAVEGNVISGNNGYGIESASDGAIIQGNKIGTNAAGTAALGNSNDGVRVFGVSTYVGGSNASEGNLISSNKNGVTLEVGANLARIEGNKIGTNLAATATLGNTQSGVVVRSNNVGIGFANNAPSINIIGGNGINGVWVTDNATGVDIFNNYIGTNASDANLANAFAGVQVSHCGTNVRVGADAAIAGAGNTIADNGINGVLAWDSVPCASIPQVLINVAVRRNSIYSNGSTGIDLAGTTSVTANDIGDADTGPNGLQNFPVLLKASPTQLYGTFNSKPNQTYTVDLFQNQVCDSSGNGEGKTLIGTTTLTTDAGGNAVYNLTGFPIAVGQVITATATDSNGNTSEFSQCLTATNAPGNIAFNTGVSNGTNENSGTAAIVVDRVNGSSGIITADYATSNGSAIAGQDYTATSGTVTFLNGETSKTIFVPIINDTLDEPSETFNVALSNPTGGAFIASPSSHIELVADDDPPPTVSIGDVSVLEGNQGTTTFTFNIPLSTASGIASSVNFSTANGTATAGIDYQATSGTVNFAAGEVVKTASVTVNTDLVPELDETFFVNLATPVNLTISDGQAVGTILDDDNPGKIAFAFATYSVSEGSPNAVITLTRTNGTAGAVAVNYTTANGTATAGSDYTFSSGTAVFNDGQTSTTFNVPITNDASGEANETVILSISTPLGGATLGTITNAVLTIFDDDGGLPPNVSIGGQIVENSLPLANVVVTLAGSQVGSTTTNASGNYSFANLPSGGNFLVTPTLSGHSFEPQSLSFTSLAADIANANFVGSTGPASRNIHVISNSTTSGQDVTVSVDLSSQGNENSAAFSIGYVSSLVFNPQVSLGSDAAGASLIVNNTSSGRLGLVIALPAGQAFAAGSRQLVKITFNTVPTLLFSTPLTFSDSPVLRRTADAGANVLPTSYSDGLIGFSQGFEADVASRPAGDGFLAVDDFTQVGRFVAGLDTPDSPVSTNEFQRGDCSPRGTKGDGVLAVDDFTQAGRYAAGLDIAQKAGGATQFGGLVSVDESSANFAVPRDIHVVDSSSSPGQQAVVSVEADVNGDENGFGFTLNYDPTKLSAPLVLAGTGAQGTFLIPNTNTPGKVGVIIAFSPGSTIAAGRKQLVTIRFNVAASIFGGPIPLVFGDAPVIRKVSDANAAALPATFTGGNLNILGPSAAGVAISGRVLNASGQPISRAAVSIANSSGEHQIARTNQFGYYLFSDIPAGQTYILSVSSKRFTFASTLLIMATEDIADADFFAEQ